MRADEATRPGQAGTTGQRAAAAPALAPLSPIAAAVLVMGSWCTVLAAGAIAPVLPQMRAAFAGAPAIDLMIGFVATAPSLAVAIAAMPIGELADRIGLRPVLLVGLLLFGVSGVLPAFALQTLPQIIAMRFVTGLGEAAVMTASTALIGLLALPAAASRLLAAQAASANILGIGVLLFGGIVGLLGWRAPFLAYAFALLLFLPALLAVPRLPRIARADTGRVAGAAWPAGLGRLLATSCLLIGWSTIALYAIIVQLGFLLAERGALDSSSIGAGQAIAASGIAIGAVAGGMLVRIPVRVRLTAAFVAIAAGCAAVAVAGGWTGTSLSAALAGLGCGVVIPTLLVRLLGCTPPERLGRVTGIWVAGTFLAQFANPPMFLLLRHLTGSAAGAFAAFGAGSAIIALIVALGRTRPGVSSSPAAAPRPLQRSGINAAAQGE